MNKIKINEKLIRIKLNEKLIKIKLIKIKKINKLNFNFKNEIKIIKKVKNKMIRNYSSSSCMASVKGL